MDRSKTKTLRELCNDLEMTRRVVQGYEVAGLVSPSGKNKYGHLLYDEKAQKRIARIRLYQQFGFAIKEIQTLIDAEDAVIKEALERRISCLKEEQVRIGALIEKAYALIKEIDEK